jgi:hypothetical protein
MAARAVVALDGPRTWPELRSAGAVRFAALDGAALGSEIRGLLADGSERERLALAGREFAERRMSATASARTIDALMRQASRG